MKALFYQCASGISGDMNLGALVDLGVPEDYLQRELARLHLDQEFTLSFSRADKIGVWGTRAHVALGLYGDGPHGIPRQDYVRVHDQRRHDSAHMAGHDHGRRHDSVRLPGHDHAHRGHGDIQRLIAASDYKDSIKALVSKMFREIAAAESRIHDMPIDEVHFHEVGATDSIVDLFGAAICLDYLDVDTVLSSPVELGSGFVRCEHGLFPVPAPATMEILKGVPCRIGGVDGEATTPTGASILKATVHTFDPRSVFVAARIGYGVGHRDFTVPNVLRVMLGELADSASPQPPQSHSHYEITANIDDMTPESFEPLLERLLEAGASDAFLTPIVMKKSRLAHMLTVLCCEQKLDLLVQVAFEHSTTIGVRLTPVGKRMLPRMLETIATSHGEVRVKIVSLPDGGRRWKVEHDDVKRLAAERGISYLALGKDIEAEVREKLHRVPAPA
jgi:uncharacterized protein (TIGR00299 family) protein